MTIEKWLRGHFHGLGSQIEIDVLEVAAVSPLEARPKQFNAVRLEDEYEDFINDKEYVNSLQYALSTLFYSMSSAVSGGTKSEKRGNRQISIGGYALTTRDREAFRNRADQIRKDLGCEIEEPDTEQGGMFDATTIPTKRYRL